MDNNVIYLNNLFNTLNHSELDANLLKIFFNKYMESDYLNDSLLLNNIDFSSANFISEKISINFDYKAHINFNILDNSPVFIFLNDELILTENINENISLNIFNFFDENVIKNVLFFNDDCILKNLNIFSILNTLFYKRLKYFVINNNYNTKPLYILKFFDNNYNSSFYSPRMFLKIKNCLELNVFDYINNMSNNVFVNYNTYMSLEDKSKVNYFFLNETNLKSLNTYSFYSKVYDNSFLNYNNHSFGSVNSKTNCYFFLFDAFSRVSSNFARLLKFKSKHDVTAKVYHYGNRSFSRIFFKSVLSNFSSCNLDALIDVDFNFCDTDSGIICKSLVLDNSSSVSMIPNLSIKNNDVKCFHGATIGFLEEEVLFYLMSRGFCKDECVHVLVHAFLNDVIYDPSLYFFSVFDFLFEKYYRF